MAGSYQIKYCDIPKYLQGGAFYRSLSSDDPEEKIEIPADCFRFDASTAANEDEFCQLFRIMMFWMLDEIPEGVLECCETRDVDLWRTAILRLPEAQQLEVEILPTLLAAYGSRDDTSFADVVNTGRWEIMVHSLARVAKDSAATTVAARVGHLRLLKLLHEQGFVWDADTCPAASEHGHLDCLKYAFEHGCAWDQRVLALAALNGHLNCIEYGHVQGLEWQPQVCANAALNGHLHCLQYARENGCHWSADTVTFAAQNGHEDCLTYALHRQCPIEDEACNQACLYGHLNCLMMLHSAGATLNEMTAFHAASCAEAACLRYLREHGCPWDVDTPTSAVLHGSLNTLRYALEHGCQYSTHIMMFAAQGKSLPCLKYLIEDRGMLVYTDVFVSSPLAADLPCIQYLITHGCHCTHARVDLRPSEIEKLHEVLETRKEEFIQCVQYAMQQGWPMNPRFVTLLQSGDHSADVWQAQAWLVEENAPSWFGSFSSRIGKYLSSS